MNERYIWAHQQLIRDLLRSAEERRPPLAGARAAVTALEMMMAAYEFHFAGHRVSFPLTNRRHPLADLTGRTASPLDSTDTCVPTRDVDAHLRRPTGSMNR